MLTIESIQTQVKDTGLKITRENYQAIAQHIHPKVLQETDWTDEEVDAYLSEDHPEEKICRQAERLNADDWTDMCVSVVATWQARAAQKHWREQRRG